MRIGVDARPLLPNPTGIGYYLKSILNELQRIDKKNSYFLISNTKIDIRIRNNRWHKIVGAFDKRMLGSLWNQFAVPKLARRLRLDLFWGTRHHLPVFLDQRIKTVLNIYDLVHRFYPETMALPNLMLERLLMKPSLRRANMVITTSLSSKTDISQVYRIDKNKISVIYPGVPTFDDQPQLSDNTTLALANKYLLFVGTLEPRKNFDLLFEAYSDSQPAKHGIHLVIAGGGGWKNKHFIEKLRANPLRSFVHMTGYVSRIQLKNLYENAIALIFPSIYEGFGFPILEAMYCGTPVVCSGCSSMPEVSRDAAIKINPHNRNELLQGLLQIINDPRLRKQLSVEGKKQASRFSWEKCATLTLNEFHKTCKREKICDL